VIKRPMDIGTVVHCLKCGLSGSVQDLHLDVELVMANATRSTSPPPSGLSTSGKGRQLTSDGSRAAASPPPPLC
jgi:pantothenate synthetase